jgi:hypothetical protein
MADDPCSADNRVLATALTWRCGEPRFAAMHFSPTIKKRLGGGDNRTNQYIILLLSGFMTIFYIMVARNYFAGGAGSFLEYANAIAHGKHTLGITQRDIGFPLLIVLAGYPFTGSLKGVIFLHAIFATLMPLLVYLCIGKNYPRIALITALACILSLTPYQFIKLYYHDQTYMFLGLLGSLCFVQLVRTHNIKYLYAMAFAFLWYSFTRPAGNYLFPCMLACAYLLERRALKHYIICCLLFVSLTFANYQHRLWVMDLKPGQSMQSYTGHQIFYNVYVYANELGIKLSPDMGPGTKRIAEAIKAEFPHPNKHPRLLGYRNYAPKGFFEQCLDFDNADDFVKRIFDRPLAEYFIIFHTLPSTATDSPLFMQASWDVIRQHPLYPLKYTGRNLLYYFFHPGMMHHRMTDMDYIGGSALEYYPNFGGVAYEIGLAGNAIGEVGEEPPGAKIGFLQRMNNYILQKWQRNYQALNTITVSLMLVALLASGLYALSRYFPTARLLRISEITGAAAIAGPTLGIFMVAFYNGLITAAFVEPIWRYQYMSMPISIICGGFGLCVLANIAVFLHKRRMKRI